MIDSFKITGLGYLIVQAYNKNETVILRSQYNGVSIM